MISLQKVFPSPWSCFLGTDHYGFDRDTRWYSFSRQSQYLGRYDQYGCRPDLLCCTVFAICVFAQVLIGWIDNQFGIQWPVSNWGNTWQYSWTDIQFKLAPIIVYGATGYAYFARLARTSMLEVLRQDYIRTARAKGLANSVVIYQHALTQCTDSHYYLYWLSDRTTCRRCLFCRKYLISQAWDSYSASIVQPRLSRYSGDCCGHRHRYSDW